MQLLLTQLFKAAPSATLLIVAICAGSMTTFALKRAKFIDGDAELYLALTFSIGGWLLALVAAVKIGSFVRGKVVARAADRAALAQRKIDAEQAAARTEAHARKLVDNLQHLDDDEGLALTFIYHRHAGRIRTNYTFPTIQGLVRLGLLVAENERETLYDRFFLIPEVVMEALRERLGPQRTDWMPRIKKPPWENPPGRNVGVQFRRLQHRSRDGTLAVSQSTLASFDSKTRYFT